MTTALKRVSKFVSAALLLTGSAGIAAAKPANCPGNENALGVSRTVEIDTTGGPGFGMQHYKAYDFLKPGEVVLTFDDGPLPGPTRKVLAALAKHCTRATFFPVGKLAAGYPEVLREVAKGGHTIGSHTVTHLNIAKKSKKTGIAEIEEGFSSVKIALGNPGSPFFRYPYLRDSKETISYLAGRNIAIFSTDLDSFDFKTRTPKKLVSRIMRNLKNRRKGILLLHDINKNTARTLPTLLNRLKADGYRIVHLRSKAPVETLAEYDAIAKKKVSGLGASAGGRPMSSVLRTVEE